MSFVNDIGKFAEVAGEYAAKGEQAVNLAKQGGEGLQKVLQTLEEAGLKDAFAEFLNANSAKVGEEIAGAAGEGGISKVSGMIQKGQTMVKQGMSMAQSLKALLGVTSIAGLAVGVTQGVEDAEFSKEIENLEGDFAGRFSKFESAAKAELESVKKGITDKAQDAKAELEREIDSLTTQLNATKERVRTDELENLKQEVRQMADKQLVTNYNTRNRNDHGSHGVHSEENVTNDMMKGLFSLANNLVTKSNEDTHDTRGNQDGQDMSEGDKVRARSRKRNSDHDEDVSERKRPRVPNDDLHDKTETQPVTRNSRPTPSTGSVPTSSTGDGGDMFD